MPGFVAADAVEPLDYDFTAFGGPKGTIVEPSRDIVDAFFRALNAVTGDMLAKAEAEDAKPEDEDTRTPTERIAAAFDAGLELRDKELDAVVALCGGTPSREDILALPRRVQQAFVGWLYGQFTNPPQPTATKPSLAVVPSA